MDTLQFYKDSLTAIGVVVVDDGAVRKPIKGNPACEVGGKPLVLPTRELLQANDWSKLHPFHPLCEDALLGQSPTIHFLQRMIQASITMYCSLLVSNLLEIAARPELQQEVKDPKIHDILEHCKFAKASTLASWKKVFNKFDETPFINIYLGKGKSIDGEKYHSVCTFDIPLLAETDDDGVLIGIKMSKNDKKTIVGLLTYIFSDVRLMVGSNDTAPYFHSLMTAFAGVAKAFNRIGKVIKKVTDYQQIDIEWAVELNDLKQFIGRIPKLPGNEGVKTGGRKKPAVTEPDVQSLYDRVNVPVREPEAAPAETAEDTPPWTDKPAATPRPSGGIDLDQILKLGKPDLSDRNVRDNRFDRRDERSDRTRSGLDLLGSSRNDRDRGDYRNSNRPERERPRSGGIDLDFLGVNTRRR